GCGRLRCAPGRSQLLRAHEEVLAEDHRPTDAGVAAGTDRWGLPGGEAAQGGVAAAQDQLVEVSAWDHSFHCRRQAAGHRLSGVLHVLRADADGLTGIAVDPRVDLTAAEGALDAVQAADEVCHERGADRKSTRLNSSHVSI